MHYSKTEIREAILKAADHIEAHPEEFNIYRGRYPSRGAQGCALAWIGYFIGHEDCDFYWISVAEKLLPTMHELGFYRVLTEFIGNCEWTRQADLCAKALRLYADKHFPEESAPKRDLMALFAPDYRRTDHVE